MVVEKTLTPLFNKDSLYSIDVLMISISFQFRFNWFCKIE